MEQRVLSALVLLCMLCVLCLGRQLDQTQEERQSICLNNLCGSGKCLPLPADSDRQYDCECDTGFQFNKDTGKCEDVSVEDLTMPTVNISGCSYSQSTTYCDVFQLQCNDKRRIQILGSKYGKLEASSHLTSRNYTDIDERLPIQCPLCNGSWSDTPYNSTQRYDLFKRCSWKSTCQPPSVGKDIAHSISYRCVPEQPSASFCNRTSKSGQLVNVLFDGSEFRKQFATEQVKPYTTQCICDIKSTSSFRVSAPDVRLVDTNEICIPGTRISGIDRAETTCSSEQIAITTREVVFFEKKRLTLSFDVAPEFIWILVQAEETNERLSKLSVECHLPTNPVPTTSHEIDLTTATTTFTDKTETISPKTDSTTSTTSSATSSTATNPGQGQPKKGFQADNDNGVPLPAIIVPIVVILITVVVVGIFVWRRRLPHHAREDDTDGQTKVSYQVPVTNGQIGNFESATSMRTDDNFLVFEQEHVYNTLDAEHNDSETIKANDVSQGHNTEYQTPDPRINNVSGINDENVHKPLNAECIDTADNINPNETVTLQSMPQTQTNEYFTLEPQSTISSEKPVSGSDSTSIGSLDNIHPNDTETLQSMPQTQTNEHFTLEPQSTILSKKPVSGSDSTSIGSLDNIHPNDTETLQSMPPTQTNEYFTFEPQSTISSGKPVNVSDTISMDNPDHSNTNATVTLQSMPITQTNEYFTLEPQNNISPETENNTAGHDYFVLQSQSLPLPVDKLEKERVDNHDPPAKDKNGEENHNYFILEANETKQN